MRRLIRLIVLGCCGLMPAAADPLPATTRANSTTADFHSNSTNVDARGPQGDTALHWAAFHGREAGVAQLIDRGSDVNAAVDNGNTPLHQAAYRGHTAVVELLIAHGAEINRRTRTGLTPLDWAERNGHRGVMRVLIAHGGRYGVASVPEKAPARRQNNGSGYGETLPDAVLFAALGRLPALPKETVSVAASTEHDQRSAEFRVQLAAMQSESAARLMWQQYLTRHPAILAGLQPSVVPTRVNGMPFYRVQGGPLTEGAAHGICDALRRDNQACLVVRASASSSEQP